MNTNTKNLKDEIKAAEQMFLTVPADKRDILTGVLLGMELAEQRAAESVEKNTKTA